MLWKFVLIFIFSIKFTAGARLEASNDDVVIEAIRENKNLIILFCKFCNSRGAKIKYILRILFLAKKGCVECRYEQSLVALREEFESALDAKVLKLESSQLQRIYDIQKKEAALVFLRRGVGLLYDGQDSADDIFDFFNDNRDPIVKELDDSNFEHLTQASTGSTTGDWLIHFYDNNCIDCNRLTATWETVGAKLKTRLNVARVNRATKGVQTAKRFKVEHVPEFIFLRMGKYYRYNLKLFEVDSFVGFATTWYTKLTPEKVVVPATPFENIVDFVVQRLKEAPNLKMSTLIANPLPVISIASFFIILLFFIFKKPKRAEATKAPAKKGAKKE